MNAHLCFDTILDLYLKLLIEYIDLMSRMSQIYMYIYM